MTWAERDVCKKRLGYILVMFVVILLIYVHFLVFTSCLIIFFGLVYTFDSMIGNDRSLFTLFRFEH